MIFSLTETFPPTHIEAHYGISHVPLISQSKQFWGKYVFLKVKQTKLWVQQINGTN